MYGWMWLLLACGCDQVFGLSRPPSIDAPLGSDAIDARPDAGTVWSMPTVDLGISIGLGDDPTFTEDLLELYYNDASNRDILIRERESTTSPWSPPKLATELNSTFQESAPEVSADGLTMLLVTARTDVPGHRGALDIAIATRPTRADVWTQPAYVQALNSASVENDASMNRDATIIVFSSNRAGNDDLWMSSRVGPTMMWGTPVKLDTVSSGMVDANSYLSADGLSLYFSSNRTGMHRLYQSHRTSVIDPFPAPTTIPEIESGQADEDPWVSPDGRDLFFIRQASTASSALMHALR